MKALSRKVVSINPDGSEVVDTLIISDDTPATIPTSGAGIEGLRTTDTFAPLSVLFIVADTTPKRYLANESGVFIAQ